MLSCGLAFCSSELPVRTYKKGIKPYWCKYATMGLYPRTNNHASIHVSRTSTLYRLTGLCLADLKSHDVTFWWYFFFFRPVVPISLSSRREEYKFKKNWKWWLHVSLFKSE
jgi:hypothetical protein